MILERGYILKKFIFIFFILFSFSCFAEEKIGDQVRYVNEQDILMNKAIDHARKSLDEFLTLAKNPPKGSTDFKLKVMLSDDRGVEHLWFTPFKEIESGFAGLLANEPEVISSVTAGKVYAFKRNQITDWGYALNGKQKGSFTVCVLFKSMDKETVDQYKKDYGFECND